MIGTKKLGIVILAMLLVVGIIILSPVVAQAQTDTPTPTESPTPTASPSATPTASATPTVSPTPTATISPTPTLSPTATATPMLDCYPRSLSFTATEGGANPAFQELSIWNAGTGVMYWEVTSSDGWIDMLPRSGTLASSDPPDAVNVYVDIANKPHDIYEGWIFVLSDSAQDLQQVRVVLTVRSVSGSATPNVSATATETQPTPTATTTPTPTPTPGAGGVPPWVWPVVGVLAVICAALAGFALVSTGVLGKMFKGKPKGDAGEDIYEGGADDSGGGGGDYGDDEV